MIQTVKNEAPFQVLTGAFTIGPSTTGYELQVGATPKDFATLFTVAPNTTRMVTNVANGSYYRLKNNEGDVIVNWVRTCKDESGGGSGSGSTYTAGEYISIEQDVISVTGITPDAYLTSADIQDLASEEYVDDAIEEALSGITLDGYWTSAETKNYVDGQVSGLTEYIEDVERVAATALTELHTDILALSAATPDMSNYYTKSEVDAEITGATEGYATEAYVDDAISGLTDMMETKEEVIASALIDLNTNKVGSTDVHTMVKLTQAQYDALTTKDPNTFYIIINS